MPNQEPRDGSPNKHRKAGEERRSQGVPLPGRAALFLFCCTVLVGCGLGIRRLYRLSMAEKLFAEDSPEAVRAAIAYSPGNAEYHVRLASFLGAEGLDEIAAAVRLNPGEAMWWIEYAVLQEIAGDNPQAEQSLLRAAQVSRYYLPRMMLASYYFRHRDIPKFRDWARKAMSIGSMRPTLVLQMAFQLGIPPAQITGELTPDRVPALEALLEELIRAAEPGDSKSAGDAADQIQPCAARLAAAGSADDAPAILRAAERLFDLGRIEQSTSLWNSLADRNWILRPRLPQTAASSFRFEWNDLRAFDWRLLPSEGVLIEEASTGGLRVTLSGRQAERCRILDRRLPLLPNTAYRITARSGGDPVDPEAGLVWRIATAGRVQLEFPAVAPNGQTSGRIETGPVPQPYVLELVYDRPQGKTRLSATIEFESVTAEPLPKIHD